MSRIETRFTALAREGRAGLITFIMGGDPDAATAAAILAGMPGAGADLIEIGMPFSDPMADGPAIQAAGLRALAAGASLRKTLDLVRGFRASDRDTPIVLMGYLNPIESYGAEAFARDAAGAGVDGLIVVDLPSEEADSLAPQARAAGIDIIRLATPTSDDARLPRVLEGAAGFLYYVSILGITGARSADDRAIEAAVARLRRHTTLPIAVGFGIKTPDAAAAVARVADAAVVGTSIVQAIEKSLDPAGKATPGTVEAALGFVRRLADGVRGARQRVPA